MRVNFLNSFTFYSIEKYLSHGAINNWINSRRNRVGLKSIFKFTNQEILMRARADLRLGIPIVLAEKNINVVVTPIEDLNQTRLNELRQIDTNSFILITARRAQTLKCPIYKAKYWKYRIRRNWNCSGCWKNCCKRLLWN